MAQRQLGRGVPGKPCCPPRARPARCPPSVGSPAACTRSRERTPAAPAKLPRCLLLPARSGCYLLPVNVDVGLCRGVTRRLRPGGTVPHILLAAARRYLHPLEFGNQPQWLRRGETRPATGSRGSRGLSLGTAAGTVVSLLALWHAVTEGSS